MEFSVGSTAQRVEHWSCKGDSPHPTFSLRLQMHILIQEFWGRAWDSAFLTSSQGMPGLTTQKGIAKAIEQKETCEPGPSLHWWGTEKAKLPYNPERSEDCIEPPSPGAPPTAPEHQAGESGLRGPARDPATWSGVWRPRWPGRPTLPGAECRAALRGEAHLSGSPTVLLGHQTLFIETETPARSHLKRLPLGEHPGPQVVSTGSSKWHPKERFCGSQVGSAGEGWKAPTYAESLLTPACLLARETPGQVTWVWVGLRGGPVPLPVPSPRGGHLSKGGSLEGRFNLEWDSDFWPSRGLDLLNSEPSLFEGPAYSRTFYHQKMMGPIRGFSQGCAWRNPPGARIDRGLNRVRQFSVFSEMHLFLIVSDRELSSSRLLPPKVSL